jgi:hypothetical protein
MVSAKEFPSKDEVDRDVLEAHSEDIKIQSVSEKE